MSPACRLSQTLSSNIGRRLVGLALSLTLGLVFTGGLIWLVNRSAGVVRAEPAAAKIAAPEDVGPTSRVQVGGRQVDGWVSVGGYEVTVTLKDGAGAVKAQESTWPDAGLHYGVNLPVTIAAGDTVEVAAGDTATAIVVDALTAHLDFDADRIIGVGPANQAFVASLSRYPSMGSYTAAVDADAAGSFTITNPFLDRNGVAAVLDLQPGDYGALSYTHADGNQVYASLGQSVFVQQNGNLVYGYAGYPTDPGVPLSITVYAPGGSVKGACSTPGT